MRSAAPSRLVIFACILAFLSIHSVEAKIVEKPDEFLTFHRELRTLATVSTPISLLQEKVDATVKRVNANPNQRHSYYVRVSEHGNPHQILKKKFGKGYSATSLTSALVMGTPEEMTTLSVENPEIIVEATPLPAEMKISADLAIIQVDETANTGSLNDKSTSDFSRCQGVDPVHYRGVPDELVLRVVIPALEEDAYIALGNYFVSLDAPDSKTGESTVKVDLSPYVEGRELYALLSVTKCADVLYIATAVAERSEVSWVEEQMPMFTHNRWASGLLQCNDAYYDSLTEKGLDGTGEIIGIGDTGIDMNNCYFHDETTTFQYQPSVNTPVLNMNHRKVIQYVTQYGDQYENSEGHGTHVASTVAGITSMNYGDYARYNGMSFGARVSFFDINRNSDGKSHIATIQDLYNNYLKVMYDSGARVITNSWGSDSQNGYTLSSGQIDEFMFDYPDCLVIFSAGNNGEAGRNTVGAPSTNKNGLSIGATLNDHDSWKGVKNKNDIGDEYGQQSIAYFSSKGPTNDGRLKPDIVAPGYFIFSAQGLDNSLPDAGLHCSIQGMAGTSMAAPALAGAALKVRQYFMKGYYPSGISNEDDAFVPSGALIKAMLVASARPMSYAGTSADDYYVLSSYPSIEQGYGRADLANVLQFSQDGTPISSSLNSLLIRGAAFDDNAPNDVYETISTGGSKSYTFFPSEDGLVRVVLAYSDAKSNPGSGNLKVNELTITVTRQNSEVVTIYENSKSYAKSNLQVIDIKDAVKGSPLMIKITGTSVPSGPLPYALVVTSVITPATPSLSEYEDPSSAGETALYDYYGSYNINDSAVAYVAVLAVIAALLIALSCTFRCTLQRKLAEIQQRQKATAPNS